MDAILSAIVISLSLFLTIQGIFTLFWMLYAWEDPSSLEKNKSPQSYLPPLYSFTCLIPAREEQDVIEPTLKAVSTINYPKDLTQIVVVCHQSDWQTIMSVNRVQAKHPNWNVELAIYDSQPMSKPKALNEGLKHARGDIVGIFDAEDEPHRDIYHITNTVLIKRNADVVQSGVQLMNYNSKWFSTLNVLEYFFWFKSALHFFNKVGATPLGGNTVFFKRGKLSAVGGWDEACLTEDADIGIRLSAAGSKIAVVYDETHVTREETPPDEASFIKQRTRWNQGFIQVIRKGEWSRIPGVFKKLFTLYILLSPLIQSLCLLYLPISLWLTITQKLPMAVSLFSYLPAYLLGIQLIVLIIGMYEFSKAYKLRFPILSPIMILISFYPYQLMLMYAAIRAVSRSIANDGDWEKTLHINAHRSEVYGQNS